MVGRLPRPAGRTRIGKPELLKIERLNISLDRSHRVVPPHIVFNPRRQKARLFPAVAGLETVIRHKTNRTPSRQSRYEYLPSLGSETHQELRRNSTRWVSLSLNPSYEAHILNFTTFCCCSPRPSTPRRTTSPALRNCGGFMPRPTPGGVPVMI